MSTPKPKRRRGRPPDREVLERTRRAARPDVALQVEKTAVAVFADIARRVRGDQPISIELLGVARLCTEWHTDYLSVQASGGTDDPHTPPPKAGEEPNKP